MAVSPSGASVRAQRIIVPRANRDLAPFAPFPIRRAYHDRARQACERHHAVTLRLPHPEAASLSKPSVSPTTLLPLLLGYLSPTPPESQNGRFNPLARSPSMPWDDDDKTKQYQRGYPNFDKFIHLALESTWLDAGRPRSRPCSLAEQVQLSRAVAQFKDEHDVDTHTCITESVPKGSFGDKAGLFLHDGLFHEHLVQARVSGFRLVADENDEGANVYSAQALEAFHAWALTWAWEEKSAREMKRPMRLQLWTSSRTKGVHGVPLPYFLASAPS